MKLLKGPIGLILVGLLVGGAVVVGVGFFFGDSLPLPFLKKDKGAEAVATNKPAKKPEPELGVMYPLKERIVNLADPGVMRYLKATIVLEMEEHSGKPIPKGEEYKKFQDEFIKEMKPHQPVIEDQINSILTTKTSAQLMTAEGKQRLKEEIKAKVNKVLGKEDVMDVYLSEFIIQ